MAGALRLNFARIRDTRKADTAPFCRKNASPLSIGVCAPLGDATSGIGRPFRRRLNSEKRAVTYCVRSLRPATFHERRKIRRRYGIAQFLRFSAGRTAV